MAEKKLLVVDGERLICDMLTQAFSRFGYRVRSAESAEEALDILQDEEFQVMFLDLDLPGMNGVDLCKRIRKALPSAVIHAITVAKRLTG